MSVMPAKQETNFVRLSSNRMVVPFTPPFSQKHTLKLIQFNITHRNNAIY